MLQNFWRLFDHFMGIRHCQVKLVNQHLCVSTLFYWSYNLNFILCWRICLQMLWNYFLQTSTPLIVYTLGCKIWCHLFLIKIENIDLYTLIASHDLKMQKTPFVLPGFYKKIKFIKSLFYNSPRTFIHHGYCWKLLCC